MDARALLLKTAFRHRISAPNIEAGYERFRALVAEPVSLEMFADAVAAALRDGLIREPIRLPEGALQCHWHLELTAAGARHARDLAGLTRGGTLTDG